MECNAEGEDVARVGDGAKEVNRAPPRAGGCGEVRVAGLNQVVNGARAEHAVVEADRVAEPKASVRATNEIIGSATARDAL